MKNVFILPTDKPSRLWVTKLGNLTRCHDTKPIKEALGNNVNIYITSDEEIKEGDWFVCNNILYYCTDIVKTHNYTGIFSGKTNTIDYNQLGCKKIILTTDQDLIKDDTQAIGDEFLCWFVKNPSCEEVEVKTYCCQEISKNYCDLRCGKHSYKIVIPKEEPCKHYFKEFGCEKLDCICEKQKILSEAKERAIQEPNLINDWLIKKGDPEIAKQVEQETEEQETLEEAGLKHCDILDKFPALVNPLFTFKEGAKWQQEQDKLSEDNIRLDERSKCELENINTFSEGYDAGISQQERSYNLEDLKNAFESAREFNSLDGIIDVHIALSMGGDNSDLQPLHFTFEEWFNQFKKK